MDLQHEPSALKCRSSAPATYPNYSSSMISNAGSQLSLRRTWWIISDEAWRKPWSRWATPKTQGTTAPCCTLRANIQATTGLLQGAHALCTDAEILFKKMDNSFLRRALGVHHKVNMKGQQQWSDGCSLKSSFG